MTKSYKKFNASILLAALFTFALTSCGGGSGGSDAKQETTPSSNSVSVSPAEIVLPATAGSGSATVTCKGDWTVSVGNKPTWLTSVSPTTGKGNGTITITTAANTERTNQSCIITISSGTNKASVAIVKQPAANNAPTKPASLSPTGTNVDRFPEFSWTASTDADNDQLKYTVMYSTDNKTWTSYSQITSNSYLPKASLSANTTYYWKVVVDDGFTGGKVESDVASFTTGTAKKYYDDCEYTVYQTATVAKPVVIIYTGDGYTQDMFEYGGQWDQEMNKGIEALFAIEPYKTYRNYFTIYKIAAYSNEAGMSSGNTDWEKATNKVDTRFKCSWAGGNSTGIGGDAGEVIEVAKKIPTVDASTFQTTINSLSYSPISVLINTNQYAGTNHFIHGFVMSPSNVYVDGFEILSIAYTPARHPSGSGYGDSWNTLRHEFGGHGFGLLADEYRYYDEVIPASTKSNTEAWKELSPIGCYGNITFINDPEQCEWAQFIGREEYAAAAIGLYEGACMYEQGVWRPEYISCMWDNRPHYNTPSRWQIYRRIKITAGETPSLEDFIANDVDKVESTSPAPAPAPATKLNGYPRPTPPVEHYLYRLK